MCIAILNEKNNTIDFNTLQTCWNNNRDGAGMLWVENGVLLSHKEMNDFNKFYDKYLKIRESNNDSRIVLHFRISTHGKINKTNCHPFFVNSELGFVHNGIISGLPHSNEYSDTFMFNKTILKKMPSDFLKHEGIMTLVEDFISYSKLVFLNADNEYTIIGEEKGIWDGDNWFSNSTYKDYGYYDVGGKKVWKKEHTSVFDNTPTRYGTYGQMWPSSDKYMGLTQERSSYYADFYDDVDDVADADVDKQDNEYDGLYQYEEPCECCHNLSDIVKFSESYKVYCCATCWGEYVAEDEGDFSTEFEV